MSETHANSSEKSSVGLGLKIHEHVSTKWIVKLFSRASLLLMLFFSPVDLFQKKKRKEPEAFFAECLTLKKNFIRFILPLSGIPFQLPSRFPTKY